MVGWLNLKYKASVVYVGTLEGRIETLERKELECQEARIKLIADNIKLQENYMHAIADNVKLMERSNDLAIRNSELVANNMALVQKKAQP